MAHLDPSPAEGTLGAASMRRLKSTVRRFASSLSEKRDEVLGLIRS